MFIDALEFNNSFSPIGMQNFYLGKVVSNEDPLKLGRVKVSIEEIFGSASVEKLPWCTPYMGSPSQFDCPEVGDLLVTYFPYGIVYFPCFMGHWNLPDNHDAYFDADYPNSVGFHRQGFGWKYNKKAKEFEIIHPEGSSIKIGADGSISFVSTKKLDFTSTEDYSITTEGKYDLTVTGKATIKADGGLEFSSDGEATFKGKSKTTIGDSSSQTLVNGMLVLLSGGGVGVCVVGSQGIGTGNLGLPILVTMITGSSKVLAPL